MNNIPFTKQNDGMSDTHFRLLEERLISFENRIGSLEKTLLLIARSLSNQDQDRNKILNDDLKLMSEFTIGRRVKFKKQSSGSNLVKSNRYNGSVIEIVPKGTLGQITGFKSGCFEVQTIDSPGEAIVVLVPPFSEIIELV